MMTFTIDQDGRAKKFLQNAMDAIKDFKPALKETKEFQLKEIGRQFTTQGRQITGGWAKRKRDYPWPILNKTGKLKDSPKEKKLTKDELYITSDIPYYPYHQQGTRKMPQRQVMAHSESMIKRVMQIFIDYINKKVQHG